jgi:hypothetical protein
MHFQVHKSVSYTLHSIITPRDEPSDMEFTSSFIRTKLNIPRTSGDLVEHPRYLTNRIKDYSKYNPHYSPSRFW